MSVLAQFSSRKWTIAATVLALALAIAGCSPFGKSAEPTPTNVPLPTETPLAVLPTYTPTMTAQPPTATPTEAPTEAPTKAAAAAAVSETKPTLTPTPKPPETKAPETKPAAGGQDAVAPVVYKTITKPAGKGDLLTNGSFEEGFDENGVGSGWTAYSNKGAVYAWIDEIQPKHVSHGTHAQLMRVMGPGEPDRFVGLYQTVEVIPGETYTLSLHGLIRSSTAMSDRTTYGHRIQWAIDDGSSKNWYEMNQDWAAWTDTGWNDVTLDAKVAPVNAFSDRVTFENQEVTLYVRGWTKWPILGSEARFYIDGIFFEGPIPGSETVVKVSAAGTTGGEEMPTTGGSATWIPIVGLIFVLGFAAWEIRRIWAR